MLNGLFWTRYCGQCSMLNNATGFDWIYVASGYTDLRQGIDGLTAVIRHQLGVDPFQKNVLFVFCGRKSVIECLRTKYPIHSKRQKN